MALDSAMIHVVLPVQYLRIAGRYRREPQVRLMVAVLQTVVDDLSSLTCEQGVEPARAAGPYEQARAYVASRDRSWPFSFENLCEAIGLDADGLRRQLRVTAPPA
jgi:hypothetical protein